MHNQHLVVSTGEQIFVENLIFPMWRWMSKRVETVNETGNALRDVQHI